jgi:RNA polymerase sigma-70 factor (ECF subfamily)
MTQPATFAEEKQRFNLLLQQIREGSEEAARQFIDEYGEAILRAVRRKLSRKLRTRFDSADFLQSVWASFFADREAIGSFAGPQAVVAYLQETARNKIGEQYRKMYRRQKSPVAREEPLANYADNSNREPNFFGTEPTPSENVSFKESFERISNDIPEELQQMLEMQRHGDTYEDIAREFGVSARTVRRIFRRLRHKHNL